MENVKQTFSTLKTEIANRPYITFIKKEVDSFEFYIGTRRFLLLAEIGDAKNMYTTHEIKRDNSYPN